MRPNSVTLEIAKKRFEENGLELLETEYISRRTKMKYVCPKHPDVVQYKSYQTLIACPGSCTLCGKKRGGMKGRRSFESVVKVFSDLGLILLEKEFKDVRQVMKFICVKHTHVVQERPYNSVHSGYGCRICTRAIKVEKLSGENGGNWRGGLTPLNEALRVSLSRWRKEVLQYHDYKCFVTGETENLEIHHLRSFNSIRDEVLNEMGFDGYFRREQRNAHDFTSEQISLMRRRIISKHSVEMGYPLTREIHREFHNLYGMRATEKDFSEFVEVRKKHPTEKRGQLTLF